MLYVPVHGTLTDGAVDRESCGVLQRRGGSPFSLLTQWPQVPGVRTTTANAHPARSLRPPKQLNSLTA